MRERESFAFNLLTCNILFEHEASVRDRQRELETEKEGFPNKNSKRYEMLQTRIVNGKALQKRIDLGGKTAIMHTNMFIYLTN